MATKKAGKEAEVQKPQPQPTRSAQMDTPNLDMDFNLEEEVLPQALIPNGTYRGAVTNVTYDSDKMAIVWEVTLNDNGGEMNDGITPIDGAKLWNRNWLPKPGDENTPASNGKGTKRDGKLSMIKNFSKAMGIDMNTPAAIVEGISDAKWIGIEVMVTVAIEEYEGNFNNNIKKMKAA